MTCPDLRADSPALAAAAAVVVATVAALDDAAAAVLLSPPAVMDAELAGSLTAEAFSAAARGWAKVARCAAESLRHLGNGLVTTSLVLPSTDASLSLSAQALSPAGVTP